MPKRLFLFSLFNTCRQIIKEACTPTIPAGNWANEELIRKDRMNGISESEFSRNLANGKYRLTESYPELHRMEDGRIIAELTRCNYASEIGNFREIVKGHLDVF